MVTSTTSLKRQAADPESALSNHKKDVEEDSRGHVHEKQSGKLQTI